MPRPMNQGTYVLLAPPHVARICISRVAGNGYDVPLARVYDEESGQAIVDRLNELKDQFDAAKASLRKRVLSAVSDAIKYEFK